jgi:hypothetical protein
VALNEFKSQAQAPVGIVAFRFFPFDVRVAGASEEPYHGLVQGVFDRMHGGIFRFVVIV